MELLKARKVADALIAELSPRCERIMVGGSIRREKPDVKDIELLVIPKTDTTFDLFGNPDQTRNLLYEAIHGGIDNERYTLAWIKPGTPHVVHWHIKPDGKYWRGLLTAKVAGWQMKVDIFLATAENFGCVELIRTGSGDFSQEVVTYAKRVGFQFDEGRLKFRNSVIDTPDERVVFEKLGLEYIAPEDRHGPQSVRVKSNRAPSPSVINKEGYQ